MAHVTHFRFKAKAGERDKILDIFRGRTDEMKATKGFQRAILTSNNNDPDEFMAGVMFDTTENYNANSNDPETNEWFQKLRSHLAGDPEWFDGTLEELIDA